MKKFTYFNFILQEPSSDSNTGITTSGTTPAKVSTSETSDEHTSKKSPKKSNNMKVVIQLLDGNKFDVEITVRKFFFCVCVYVCYNSDSPPSDKITVDNVFL